MEGLGQKEVKRHETGQWDGWKQKELKRHETGQGKGRKYYQKALGRTTDKKEWNEHETGQWDGRKRYQNLLGGRQTNGRVRPGNGGTVVSPGTR